MRRELRFKISASEELDRLEKDESSKGLLKQVRKTLGYLETNLKTKSLQTHEFKSLSKRYEVKTFEAYAQQNIPAAYRVFWQYGPDTQDERGNRIPIITIIGIKVSPHTRNQCELPSLCGLPIPLNLSVSMDFGRSFVHRLGQNRPTPWL